MSTTPDDSSPTTPGRDEAGLVEARRDPLTDHHDDAHVTSGGAATHSRAAATWTGLVIGILVLIVLLIFILQNLDSATLHLFAWDFTLPLGVTILLAAIAGAIVMALAGGVRILQMRRAAKRST